jgi:hypothetical protein
MSKTWIAVIAGVGGIGVGLLIAKFYAQSDATSSINSGLAAIGIGPGAIQTVVDRALVPSFS